MTISMSSASIPAFKRMLRNAKAWLAKAEAHAEAKRFDPTVLVNARLAPDMLPFAAQIRIACDHAKGAAARLADVELPRFEDDEKTLPELVARIDKTLAFLDTVPREKIDGSEEREITIPRIDLKFSGESYLVGYALPNFYFHLTTAYAILRHNGVELGKVDFLNGAAAR